MTNLQFAQQVQEQKSWCWVATGLSIAQYFRRGVDATQSDFFRTGSDLGEGDDVQNWTGRMETVQNALWALGLRPGTIAEGPVSFDIIKREIDAGRPVLARVDWNDDGDHAAGGAHALVIYGYHGDSIAFGDPWAESERYQEMTYNSLVANDRFRWVRSLHQISASPASVVQREDARQLADQPSLDQWNAFEKYRTVEGR